jgi:hypothetical protein
MTTAATYTNRGHLEGDTLTRALINAAARGIRPRRGDSETAYLSLSEHDGERAIAVMLCDHLAVIIDSTG